MSLRIKKISVHAFRGIPDLETEIGGRNLILLGETGTGKSSIVDAIEFFFTGKVSHLEGIRGLSLHRHGTHIGFKPGDVKVGITFDPGNVSLGRTFTSVPSPPKLLQDYFEVAQRGTCILRRSQILEFIVSEPAERFRVIASMIGIEPLEDVELEMMRLRDDLKGKVDSEKRETSRLILDLSIVLGKDIKDVGEVLPIVNEVLREASLPLLGSLEDVDKHVQKMLRTVKKAESMDRIRILNEVLGATKRVPVPDNLASTLNSFNDRIKRLLKKDIRLGLSIADLLDKGRRVIEEAELEVCPLCEKEIDDREKVLTRIEERLRTLRDLSEKASEVRTEYVPIVNQLNAVEEKLNLIASKIELFPEVAGEKDKLSQKAEFLKDFVRKVGFAKDLRGEIPVQAFKREQVEIKGVWDSISAKCTQMLDDIGLTEKEKQVLEVVRLIEQARSKAKDISRVTSKLKTSENQHRLAEKIYLAFSETKKIKIQEIYSSIQGEIRGFYSFLHPNEPHRNIELVVAPGRRASTELRIESFGRGGEDPRALTSEGHLDSLGLCIFLAFTNKFNEGCSLLVLDDVVTTLDGRHRENICKLLFQRFQEKQLVITTHDEVWYEQLRARQRACGIEGSFENLTIVDWSVDSGPTTRPYRTRWQKIQEKVAVRDKTGAGNGGRQYLEWILERICKNIQARPIFKGSERYDVGDLLAPVKKRLGDLVKDSGFKAKVFRAFQEVESTVIMGNLLSHNNILADKISIQEVNSFCSSVRALHKVFLCPNCEHLVDYYKDLGMIRCSSPTCKDPMTVATR